MDRLITTEFEWHCLNCDAWGKTLESATEHSVERTHGVVSRLEWQTRKAEDREAHEAEIAELDRYEEDGLLD